MNLSYAWLQELVAFDLAPPALAERLTMAGCNIEEVHEIDGDFRLVAEVTANRPDWLCHWGVAREIATLTNKTFRLPPWDLCEEGPPITDLITVEVPAADLCPRYTARAILGIKVGESPDWIKRRLEAIGVRPINNVVDITNYILFETNQPLHAFDLDLLAGRRIVARRACPGETMTALDGTNCRLTEEMLVIADAERPVAVAGVMGGVETAVNERTCNILLEAAYFEPCQVRRTSRSLRLFSDSSYRFERSIDPSAVAHLSARAAQLIAACSGGKVASGIIDTAPDLGQPWEVTMRFERCQRLLGMHIEGSTVAEIFRSLGMEVLHRDAVGIRVRVPSFRQDLRREADLIEEVIRVFGYERVPENVALTVSRTSMPPAVSALRMAREALVGFGYFECATDTFLPPAWLTGYPGAAAATPLLLRNPVNAERPALRTTLVPSLLEVRQRNALETEVRLFEVSRVYGAEGDSPDPLRLAVLDDRGMEYARGALEGVLAALRCEAKLVVEPIAERETPPALACAAWLRLGDHPAGFLGIPSAATLRRHDLRQQPAVAEIDFDLLATLPRQRRLFRPLPRFPSVRRDIALVVREEVKWAEIERLLQGRWQLIEEIALESIYRGTSVGEGYKSVAFSLILRAPDRSLTDAEANALRDAVVAHLTAEIAGARLR